MTSTGFCKCSCSPSPYRGSHYHSGRLLKDSCLGPKKLRLAAHKSAPSIRLRQPRLCYPISDDHRLTMCFHNGSVLAFHVCHTTRRAIYNNTHGNISIKCFVCTVSRFAQSDRIAGDIIDLACACIQTQTGLSLLQLVWLQQQFIYTQIWLLNNEVIHEVHIPHRIT